MHRYRAVIDAIAADRKTCRVTFVDYGNDDTVPLDQLLVDEGAADPTDPSALVSKVTMSGDTGPVANDSCKDSHDQKSGYSNLTSTAQNVATAADRVGANTEQEGGGLPGFGSPRGQASRKMPAASVEWAVGDRCACVYRADGLLYNGSVVAVEVPGVAYTVQFEGYGNVQTGNSPQDLRSPMVPAQMGVNTSSHWSESSRAYAGGPWNHLAGGAGHAGGPPQLPPGVSESLASMLMSWYQSGFHTGYYLAEQELLRQRGPASHRF